ncbi:RIP metalloprotease RseP [Fusibacter sp. 3D3]|uniref:RIP metalloprotease RseP n=1 Tax=Fusibacter sp. 3D3 TaxID=1048380 RepID=UPI000855FD21|nr:RIP metalloprotease RseP [Fusibacter sp. 3D3]GAU79838.1 membrane-associated zinc metalloprotease [Fusibacter sp. 3D3]
MLPTTLLTTLLTIVSFIFVFGIIVLAHEFGHFITARMNGIKIHEFSLGMGPALLKKQGPETLYSVRAFPIGGYVKMEGEDGESEDPRSFVQKKPWQRLIVLAAGAMMNFVLAYILLVIIMFSVGYPSNTVDQVLENSPAEAAGLMSGDTIVKINEHEINTWEAIVEHINNSDGQLLDIEVLRNNETVNIKVKPELAPEDSVYRVGISPLSVKQIGKSFPLAGKQFGTFFTSIFQFFAQLGSGKVEGEVVGPIGIVNVIGQASRAGFLNLLFIAAYISINLGIVNLLPFPALDGGRIIFVIIEMIIGRPIDREKEGYVHFVGFAILMALMVFLVFRDISKL